MIDLAAIEAAPFVRFIGLTAGIYPTLSALHILGIALLFGPIAVVDLRLMGALGPRMDEALPLLIRTAATGLGLAIATGTLLAGVRITEYVSNPFFLAKLGLVVAGAANALAFHAIAPAPARGAVPFAVASLVTWLAVIFAGRWIAFS